MSAGARRGRTTGACRPLPIRLLVLERHGVLQKSTVSENPVLGWGFEGAKKELQIAADGEKQQQWQATSACHQFERRGRTKSCSAVASDFVAEAIASGGSSGFVFGSRKGFRETGRGGGSSNGDRGDGTDGEAVRLRKGFFDDRLSDRPGEDWPGTSVTRSSLHALLVHACCDV